MFFLKFLEFKAFLKLDRLCLSLKISALCQSRNLGSFANQAQRGDLALNRPYVGVSNKTELKKSHFLSLDVIKFWKKVTSNDFWNICFNFSIALLLEHFFFRKIFLVSQQYASADLWKMLISNYFYFLVLW